MKHSLALLFSVATSFANVGFVAGEPMVLVIGDSMESGAGLFVREDEYPEDPIGNPAEIDGETFFFGAGEGSCLRDQDKIPGAFMAKERGIPLVNLACAASKSHHSLVQWNYAKTMYDLEDAIIIITIGANDAVQLAPGGLYTLDTILKCFSAVLPFQNVDTDSLLDWNELETRVDSVIRVIVQEAPASSKIRVVGYPLQFRPLWGTICWSITFPCARSFDALMARINSVLQPITEKYMSAVPNLKFVSLTEGNPLPSAVCSLRNTHIRDLALTRFAWPIELSTLSGSSFHPKEQGNTIIAKLITESL